MKSPVFGPSVEIRTRGLLNPIQARYQTSPHPDTLSRDSFHIVSHHGEKCKHYFLIFLKKQLYVINAQKLREYTGGTS